MQLHTQIFSFYYVGFHYTLSRNLKCMKTDGLSNQMLLAFTYQRVLSGFVLHFIYSTPTRFALNTVELRKFDGLRNSPPFLPLCFRLSLGPVKPCSG